MHQFKIPKVIEVFYFAPISIYRLEASQLLSESNNQFFNKVCHFTLDDNSASSYKARELKTVYLDFNCQYLKLSMQKCYSNDKNMFNQTAIVSLKCSGQQIGSYESHALGEDGHNATQVLGDEPVKGINNQIVPRNLKLKTVSHDQLDPQILERIQELEDIKQEAL